MFLNDGHFRRLPACSPCCGSSSGSARRSLRYAAGRRCRCAGDAVNPHVAQDCGRPGAGAGGDQAPQKPRVQRRAGRLQKRVCPGLRGSAAADPRACVLLTTRGAGAAVRARCPCGPRVGPATSLRHARTHTHSQLGPGRTVNGINVDDQGFNIFGDTDDKLTASYVSRVCRSSSGRGGSGWWACGGVDERGLTGGGARVHAQECMSARLHAPALRETVRGGIPRAALHELGQLTSACSCPSWVPCPSLETASAVVQDLEPRSQQSQGRDTRPTVD